MKRSPYGGEVGVLYFNTGGKVFSTVTCNTPLTQESLPTRNGNQHVIHVCLFLSLVGHHQMSFFKYEGD